MLLSVSRKVLTLVVIAALLSLSLVHLVEDPVFDASPPAEVAITAQADDVETYCLLKAGPELSFNLELAPAEQLQLQIASLRLPVQPAADRFSLEDFASRIFIPPRSIS